MQREERGKFAPSENRPAGKYKIDTVDCVCDGKAGADDMHVFRSAKEIPTNGKTFMALDYSKTVL